MTPTWIEPPPRRQSSGPGCFAKGCLILVIFVLVLAIAFVFGSIYAVKRLRTEFFATERVQLPANNSSADEQQLALAKWKIFERSARAHAPTQIEMTGEELNALIAADPRLRDKAFVTIDGSVVKLQVSIPIESRWFKGRYVNGECVVQAPTDNDPNHTRLTNVLVNGRPVPDDVLILRGPFTIRRYIEEWDQENDIKTFEIRDGKIILETKGSG